MINDKNKRILEDVILFRVDKHQMLLVERNATGCSESSCVVNVSGMSTWCHKRHSWSFYSSKDTGIREADLAFLWYSRGWVERSCSCYFTLKIGNMVWLWNVYIILRSFLHEHIRLCHFTGLTHQGRRC